MALLGIPPWLMPTDVIGAASAGGRLGLGAAELGERARESDQRTGLGYAQLGAEEASAGARLHAAAAQNALNLALHQSSLEEERRRDEASQRARAEALAETVRSDKAAEGLKKTQFEELGKRQTQKEDAAMKLAKFKALSSQLDHAKRAKMVADANLDSDASSRAQQEIDALSQQLQEFSATGEVSPASGTTAPLGPSILLPQIPMSGTFTLPEGFNPAMLLAPLGNEDQFSIKRK